MTARNIYTLLAGVVTILIGSWAIYAVSQQIANRVPTVQPIIDTVQSSEPDAPEQSSTFETSSMRFFAVGDIMLSRTVADKMQRHGFAYPFSEMRTVLQEADAVFANLECPITEGRRIVAEELTFRADPGVESAMAEANIDLVSLANNHSLNFGTDGILDTMSYLRAAGIQFAGAGEDAAASVQPAFLERNGLTLAFLAYTDGALVPASYEAVAERPGNAFMDIAQMQAGVRSAATQSDHVVVSMHAGTEYVYSPTQKQVDFAHAAIDAGAEIVIGHHPHVVQNVEKYKGKYIFYSLGNFIFDQMWSQPTREGMLLDMTLTNNGIEQISFLPLIIEDYAKPRLATTKEAGPIIGRLQLAKIDCPCSIRTADAE